MKYKKQIYLLWMLPALFIFPFVLPLQAKTPKKQYSAKEFLNITQHPPGKKTWAQLEGTVTHKRKGQSIKTAPLYFGIRFTPEETFAQIFISKNEAYSIGQSYYAAKEKVTVIRQGTGKNKPSTLASFGIKPDDLTMSFLFWKLNKELPVDSAKGQACRVFLLEAPDGTEVAKAYISSSYFFPLKVEWTKINENKPYRMLEVTSFKKVNKLWLINTIMLSGPGWRTKINFSKCNAGLVADGTPEGLFKSLK